MKISKASIDRYAVVKIINELANLKQFTHLLQYLNELIKLPEISHQEIIKLHDELEDIMTPPPLKLVATYNVYHKIFKSNKEHSCLMMVNII